jgi:hypothetical protein
MEGGWGTHLLALDVLDVDDVEHTGVAIAALELSDAPPVAPAVAVNLAPDLELEQASRAHRLEVNLVDCRRDEWSCEHRLLPRHVGKG